MRIPARYRRQIVRALRVARGSAGTISILRALAGEGVNEATAGAWIAEGRVLLERGWLPNHWICNDIGCGALVPWKDAKTAKKAAPSECPECGGSEFYTPSDDERTAMLLAYTDSGAEHVLATKAGKALHHILDERDPKYAGAQARLILAVNATVDPLRWGRAVREMSGTASAATPSWAHSLSQDDLDRLPPEALEELREIALQQRALDDRAREVVVRALKGEVIEVEAREREKIMVEGKEDE